MPETFISPRIGRRSHQRGVILRRIQPRPVIMSIRNRASWHPQRVTHRNCVGDHAGAPGRVPSHPRRRPHRRALAERRRPARQPRLAPGPLLGRGPGHQPGPPAGGRRCLDRRRRRRRLRRIAHAAQPGRRSPDRSRRPARGRAARGLRGAAHAVGLAASYRRSAPFAHAALVSGSAGIVVTTDGRQPASVMAFTFAAGKIAEIYVLAGRSRLTRLGPAPPGHSTGRTR